MSSLFDRAKWIVIPAALVMAACAFVGLRSLWSLLDANWGESHGPYSHGYVVLLMSVWLAVVYWRRRPPSQMKPEWLAAVLLLGVVTVLATLDLLFVNATRLVLIPTLVLAVILFVFGRSAAATLFWPAVFLFFALPQWWLINGALQSLTSRATNFWVHLLGVPAYVEGNFVHVPAGVFEIASGCSGLNYVVSALALAAFYSLMYLRKRSHACLLLVIAALLAIVSNWARVIALVMIGIETDMQHYLVRVDHLYFGWAIFFACLLPMFVLARRLEDKEFREAPPVAPSGRQTVRYDVRILPAAIVAGAILLAPKALVMGDASSARQFAVLPSQLPHYPSVSESARTLEPRFANAPAQQIVYSVDGHRVEVSRVLYAQQLADARLLLPENDFFGPHFRSVSQSSVGIRLGDISLRVDERTGYVADRLHIVWTWYWVAGYPADSKLTAKLFELRGLLRHRRDAAGLAMAAECIPDCESARIRLQAVARDARAFQPSPLGPER